MRHGPSLALSIALVATVAACGSVPPTVAPPPSVSPTTSSTGATDRSRLDATTRDATARAGVARTDDAMRADAARRATDTGERVRAAAAVTTRIYFAFDSDVLGADQVATLDAKLPALSRYASVRIRILGNADDRGSEEYNLALGQRRAAMAKRYLVDHGIDATRIDVVSFGNERPVCRGEDDACWSQNRRDEFEIVAGELREKP